MCVCACVCVFWVEKAARLTAFRTLCVSSAFVDFGDEGDRDVLLYHESYRALEACAGGGMLIGVIWSQGLLPPLLFGFSSFFSTNFCCDSFDSFLFVFFVVFFFFFLLYKSVFPMKCGAQWQAVLRGCMRAAVGDYDLSARLSWQTRTPSARAEQQRARSSRFNFHASSTIPVAPGTLRTSGQSVVVHPIPIDTRQLFFIFH